jgi:hypothetical protein
MKILWIAQAIYFMSYVGCEEQSCHDLCGFI